MIKRLARLFKSQQQLEDEILNQYDLVAYIGGNKFIHCSVSHSLMISDICPADFKSCLFPEYVCIQVQKRT